MVYGTWSSRHSSNEVRQLRHCWSVLQEMAAVAACQYHLPSHPLAGQTQQQRLTLSCLWNTVNQFTCNNNNNHCSGEPGAYQCFSTGFHQQSGPKKSVTVPATTERLSFYSSTSLWRSNVLTLCFCMTHSASTARTIAIPATFLTFVFNTWQPLLTGVLKTNNNNKNCHDVISINSLHR